MAFIRAKKIRGHTYYYRVQSYVENGKIKQKVLKYLGKEIPEEYLNEYRKRGDRAGLPKTRNSRWLLLVNKNFSSGDKKWRKMGKVREHLWLSESLESITRLITMLVKSEYGRSLRE